jgi:hypothetical protein
LSAGRAGTRGEPAKLSRDVIKKCKAVAKAAEAKEE